MTCNIVIIFFSPPIHLSFPPYLFSFYPFPILFLSSHFIVFLSLCHFTVFSSYHFTVFSPSVHLFLSSSFHFPFLYLFFFRLFCPISSLYFLISLSLHFFYLFLFFFLIFYSSFLFFPDSPLFSFYPISLSPSFSFSFSLHTMLSLFYPIPLFNSIPTPLQNWYLLVISLPVYMEKFVIQIHWLFPDNLMTFQILATILQKRDSMHWIQKTEDVSIYEKKWSLQISIDKTGKITQYERRILWQA